jgi:hypothetical protein
VKRPEFKLKGGIRRPSFGRGGAGGGGRPRLETPQFLDDLYRDLRDRRLLPVVILLLVAIVAVPVALSASSDPPPAVDAAAGIVPADTPEAQAAVLAENPGLRNYKERLDELKAKNPFHQLFESGRLGLPAGAAPSSGSGGGGGASSAPPTTGAPTATGAPTTAGGDTGGSFSTDTPSDTAPTTPVETPDQGGGSGGGTQFLAFRIDVFYGPEGQVKKQSNIKALDVLNPVGLFVGVGEDSKRAVFMLSTDVVGVPGEGQCAPSPDRCEFLGLKEGEAVDILYQPAGSPAPAIYKLRLEQIMLVPLKNDPASSGEKASGTILPG